MTNIALLTAGFGDGHHQVALALQSAFLQNGVKAEVFNCSRGETSHPGISEHIYEWSTRYFPAVYGASYRWTASFGQGHPLWRLLSISSTLRLSKQLAEFHPDVILRLFPDHSFVFWKPRSKSRPFIATVLTDYSVHGRWFHSQCDTYYIPHSDLFNSIRRFASPNARVRVTGIPLRPQFSNLSQHVSLKVPAATRPYILVATGGRGLFPDLRRSIGRIRRVWTDSKVYIMCGRNQSMLETVNEMHAEDGLIEALPFVQNVAEWYASAKFIVTKAGGVTVAECLASQCPMIIFKPQPGQEQDNALFLERLGAARVALDTKQFAGILADLQLPGVLEKMARACEEISLPSATEEVVRDVLKTLQEYQVLKNTDFSLQQRHLTD